MVAFAFSGLRVLITGGAGFIGSHLAERLLQLNSTVHVVDNLTPYYDVSLKHEALARLHSLNGTFSLTDITNYTALYTVTENFAPHVVVHLAAQAGVRHSLQFPLQNVQTNVQGTMNVLEVCRSLNISKLVLASSSSVYGEDSEVPFREEEVSDHPISVYAASKRSTELFAHVYHTIHKMKICNLRFFTVYGPRGRPDMAVFKFIHNQKISVYGDGTQLREFTYIDDIVDGVLGAMTRLTDVSYFTVNLGGGAVHSVNDLIRVIQQVTNKTMQIEYMDKQPGDVLLTQADQKLAEALIDFRPKVDLLEGVSRTFQWYLNWRNHTSFEIQLICYVFYYLCSSVVANGRSN